MTPPLTYTATTQPNGDVTIVLGEGTHRRGQGLLFRATNGVSIRSNEYPEWIATLYVQGTFYQGDKNTIHIPAADWQRVKQALDEYGAVQANAEQAEETTVEGKTYRVEEGDVAVSVRDQRDRAAAFFYLSDGATRADADELCAKLNARAEAERKATEVRVDYVDNGVHLYIGDRKWPNCCVGFSCGDGDGITKAQAHKLAAATAEALRGILRGEATNGVK